MLGGVEEMMMNKIEAVVCLVFGFLLSSSLWGAGEKLCQVVYKAGLYPGVVVEGRCVISAADRVVKASIYKNFKVSGNILWLKPGALAGWLYQAYWPLRAGIGPVVPPENSWPIDSKPVIGGAKAGQHFYICRAKYEKEFYIGRVNQQQCDIVVNEKVLKQNTYEVLFQSEE